MSPAGGVARELAVDAFFAHTVEALRFPSCGTARENFIDQVLELRALLAGPRGAALWAMISGARSDPNLPRKRWGGAHGARDRRGRVLDVDAALDLLYGPLYALDDARRSPTERETRACLELAASAIFRH